MACAFNKPLIAIYKRDMEGFEAWKPKSKCNRVIFSENFESLNEIDIDLKSKKRMFRILQGDVGSGKTIVSLLAISNIIECNYQCALMGPTEILANQHYELAKKIIEAQMSRKDKVRKASTVIENISSKKILKKNILYYHKNILRKLNEKLL